MTITLNGDRYEVPAATTTVSELLHRLNIDPHRVAVERNLVVLKRAAFDTTPIAEGDQIEVVNFVGGGESGVRPRNDNATAEDAEVKSYRPSGVNLHVLRGHL